MGDMMQKYIKVSEVAKMFGVSRQTVRNWVSKGMLESLTVEGTQYVSKRSLKKVSDGLHKVVGAENRVRELEERISELESKYADSIIELRNCCNDNKALSCDRQILSQLLPTFLKLIQQRPDDSSRRDTEILQMLLMGDDINTISSHFKLTRTRILQIIEKELSEIQYNIEDYLRLKEDRDNLREAVEILRINKRSLENIRYEIKYMDNVKPSILTKKLYDFNLSVRAINCCRFGEITTIADLVSHTPYQLLTIRSMGKKTLAELEELVSSLGLELGKNYVVNPDGAVVEAITKN